MQLGFIIFISLGFILRFTMYKEYEALILVSIIFVLWSEFTNYVWGSLALFSMMIGYFIAIIFKRR